MAVRSSCSYSEAVLQIPENLAAQIPLIMAGSADPDSGRSAVSSRTGDPRLGSRDREGSVYSDRKREDVRLLLSASVPQGRNAKLTEVSLRTIRRIAREPADAAKPDSGAKPRRSVP